MFERFTTAARDVVVGAQHEREEFGHPYVGTEHLLLGLLNEGTGGAYAVLRRAGVNRIQVREDVRRYLRQGPLGDADAEALKAIGIDLNEVRAKVEETFGPGALRVPASPKRGFFQKPGRFSMRARKVLELSLREAIRLHDNFIGPEHILLGLIREGEGLAVKIMVDRGVRLPDLRDQTEAQLKKLRDVS
jgi:ATP-dependent Clp protease ATP-binding subunit ClpA